MNYTTVFDMAQDGYTAWWAPAFGLIFAAVGALLVFAPDPMVRLLPSGLQGTARRIFNWLFFSFALFWTATAFIVTFGEYETGVAALRDDTASVVEGRVTNFVPMPYTGHAQEHFTVSGQRFSYSDYTMSSRFHNSASHGGPIREGLQVRITYLGQRILRLEIAE